MTVTNHVLTGAVIASAIHQPVAAVVLALISHFVCDAIPHFGIYEDDHIKRNANRLFRLVRVIDLVLMAGAVVFALLLGAGQIAWFTILACMAAAALPDAVWIPQFVREVKTQHEEPLTGFNKFHQDIQWSEKPGGLIVEGIWLAACMYILLRLL